MRGRCWSPSPVTKQGDAAGGWEGAAVEDKLHDAAGEAGKKMPQAAATGPDLSLQGQGAVDLQEGPLRVSSCIVQGSPRGSPMGWMLVASWSDAALGHAAWLGGRGERHHLVCCVHCARRCWCPAQPGSCPVSLRQAWRSSSWSIGTACLRPCVSKVPSRRPAAGKKTNTIKAKKAEFATVVKF